MNLNHLPKHIHGEMKTAARRRDMLQRKEEELQELRDKIKELCNKEIDTNGYEERNQNSLYKLWLEKHSEEISIYNDNQDDFIATAWQTCWPEETDNMLFQYLHTYLNVNFKWFARARYAYQYNGYVELATVDPCIINNALPNINGCYYKCPGDYGEHFNYGSVSKRFNEFINYTSSPNLRENRKVSNIYTGVGIAFQHCDIEVKVNGEKEITTIAKLWYRMIAGIRTDDAGLAQIGMMRNKVCEGCKSNETYIAHQHYFEDGYRTVGKRFLFLSKLLDRDLDEIEKLIDALSYKSMIRIDAPQDSLCAYCCIHEEEKKTDRVKNLLIKMRTKKEEEGY